MPYCLQSHDGASADSDKDCRVELVLQAVHRRAQGKLPFAAE
jgi:hypothetical protein